MNLLLVGKEENNLHKRINRRGGVEEMLWFKSKKSTKKVKGRDKHYTRNFLKIRKIRHRGTLK